MKRVDIASKTITLLTALSVVYAALEANLIFVAPIITLAIPYTFMKEKGFEKYNQNKKTLNNLFLFNIITFILVAITTNHMNTVIFDTVVNMVVSYIYLKITWSIESKQETIYKNPEALYKKLEDKIQVLEAMKQKLQSDIENAKNEKVKSSLEIKLGALEQKLNKDKSQLEMIKIKIEAIKHNSK